MISTLPYLMLFHSPAPTLCYYYTSNISMAVVPFSYHDKIPRTEKYLFFKIIFGNVNYSNLCYLKLQ